VILRVHSSLKVLMSGQARHFYDFGPFRLNAHEHLLLRDGEVVPLAAKALDLLVALVESRGHVLSKEELMKQVWPDSFVEEASLSHHVFTLRKALGEDKNGGVFIETIPRRDYPLWRTWLRCGTKALIW
jgi:DNA-binding winged helix-turn-helix (wHTH) protein